MPPTTPTEEPDTEEAAPTPATFESVLVTPINNGEGIRTSPVLKKGNGEVVSTLEDLPEGIAKSAWMKQTTGRLPLRIVLADGTYFLSSSWVWSFQHSGRADSPITVEAQTPGKVVISGAKFLTVPVATHKGADRVTTDVSSTGVTAIDQLWVNGGRAVLARAPNVGSFFYVKRPVTSWNGGGVLNDADIKTQAFTAEPAALAYLNGLTGRQKSEAVLVALQSWMAGHHRIQATNGNSDVLVSPPAKWPFLHSKFGFAQRYFIENVPTALDDAGEWYYDSATARLTYLPHPAQKQSDVVFALPRVRQLLHLRAQASTNKWVEHLHFKGLKFRYAQVPMPAEGFNDSQAGAEIEPAIQMDSVRNVTLSDCEVSRVGGYGIWLRHNVKNVTVSGCEIYDTGAGGIKVGMSNQPADVNATGYNAIRGNRIHATGFQFPGSVGVWVGQSSYNTVSDNLIGDTTYTGISVGWSWGYGESKAHHNTITRNFLYDIMQSSLSDGGGIYTLGVSDGTVITGNVIKNVRGFQQYGAGAWGLYNDEGSSHILMDSNVVVGTDSGGYVMHYGRDITVSNNVLAHGNSAEVKITKSEPVRQVLFDRNYLAPTLSGFISYGMTPIQAVYDGNLLSRQYLPWISSPKECGDGCVVADDLTIQAGDVLDVPKLLKGGSVVKLPAGMPQNWSAGPITPYMSPATRWAVPPSAMPKRIYEFDAATADLGSNAPGMRILPNERPDLISVIRGSDGQQCLAFKDSPNMSNSYEPYSLVETDYATGTSTVTFTLKADAATEFIHEWRDFRANPYKSGPRIVFSAARGWIEVNYKKLTPLPVGQWITVTVTARQGKNVSWDLRVKYADGSVYNLPNQQPLDADWTTTKAVFFISAAKTNSTTCMGSLTIGND